MLGRTYECKYFLNDSTWLGRLCYKSIIKLRQCNIFARPHSGTSTFAHIANALELAPHRPAFLDAGNTDFSLWMQPHFHRNRAVISNLWPPRFTLPLGRTRIQSSELLGVELYQIWILRMRESGSLVNSDSCSYNIPGLMPTENLKKAFPR